MNSKIILGDVQAISELYSYPNIPGSTESLSDTVLHWFKQTLDRDGVSEHVQATVTLENDQVALELIGNDADEDIAQVIALYSERLPALLQIGQNALNNVIPQLHKVDKWDPENTGQWRFFLPLGQAMARQKSVQFFHYPPIRLLDPMRDYLNDPVPVRWEELLQINGVESEQSSWRYETVVDATPIAAPDDQGSKKVDKTKYKYGLIPIEYFSEYQIELTRLMLNPAPGNLDFTVPVVIYGAHPRSEFEHLFLEGTGQKLGINKTALAKIVPNRKTAVLATNHPYRFYAQAQIDDKHPETGYVGSGQIAPGHMRSAVNLMKDDLAAARWQVRMAADPSLDPQETMTECIEYWQQDAQLKTVCQLTLHQGSLYYPDPNALQFCFKVSMEEAQKICEETSLEVLLDR
ncbi:MAG: hypothetical protein MI864_03910 [Pseudomonadales bacterium]|nr:hypothetical protein [Pseudomonadales bacterium]